MDEVVPWAAFPRRMTERTSSSRALRRVAAGISSQEWTTTLGRLAPARNKRLLALCRGCGKCRITLRRKSLLVLQMALKEVVPRPASSASTWRAWSNCWLVCCTSCCTWPAAFNRLAQPVLIYSTANHFIHTACTAATTCSCILPELERTATHICIYHQLKAQHCSHL